MVATFLVTSLLFGTCQVALAYSLNQSSSTDPQTQARAKYQKALVLRNHSRFVEADTYFLQAQQQYQSLANWNMTVHCAIYRAQINYDLSRLDSVQQIIQLAQAVLDKEELKDENFKQERIFFFYAMYYEATAQYQAASDILNRATAILRKVDKPIALDSSYMSSHKSLAGSIYYDRRDYEAAINNYQTALSLFPVSRPDQEKALNLNNNLGLALIEQGQVKKGMAFLEKSLAILPTLDREISFDDYLQTYFNLVKGYLLLDNPDLAIQYLNLAQPLLSKKKDDTHIWHSLRAQIREQQGQLTGALNNYQIALSNRKRVRGNHHPSVARLYLSIGKLASKTQDTTQAFDAFQNGLSVLDEQFVEANIFATPSLQKISDFYLLIQLLIEKGELLRTQYPKAVEKTLPTYRVAIEAIDSLRLLYESDASKLLLSKEAKAVFGAAIELLFQLNAATPKQAYLEEAFQYMEKSKALLLLENIRKWRNIRLRNSEKDAKSTQFTTLLEQEKNAKLDLILLQRTIDDARKKTETAASIQINTLERALREVTAQYEQVKAQLFTKFPQYYQASYGNSVANIRSIQDQLLSNQETALVSYFISAEQAFAMLVRPDSAYLEKIPDLSLWQDDFNTYQNALRTPVNNVLENKAFENFVSSATKLCTQLLSPLLKNLPVRYDRLYVVPDDILGFMAFESLLVSEADPEQLSYALSELDYLLEHFVLAYGYSATLLLESLNRRTTTDQRKDYGGFAPIF